MPVRSPAPLFALLTLVVAVSLGTRVASAQTPHFRDNLWCLEFDDRRYGLGEVWMGGFLYTTVCCGHDHFFKIRFRAHQVAIGLLLPVVATVAGVTTAVRRKSSGPAE